MSRSEIPDEVSDRLVGDIYDCMKVYLEQLLYGGRNRTAIGYKKMRVEEAMKALERECGFVE